MLGARSSLSPVPGSCAAKWTTGSTPNIQGHAQSGAHDTRTSALTTSTRSHETACERPPPVEIALRPELATLTTRPTSSGG
jgi:hypothetical protein